MGVSGNRAPVVGTGKLVGMLLVTWLTFPLFIGLGNLIWLWNDMHYRRRAAIALGISFTTTLAVIIVLMPLIAVYVLISASILTLAGLPWSMAIELQNTHFMLWMAAQFPITWPIVAITLGMAIWMTLDALRAYKTYKPG